MITTMEDSNKEITSTRLARRPKGVVTKQWLVVSQVGKSRIEEVGKHSIMRRTGIPARDLRILDPTLSYPSTILGRERAIVVNLEHIKAIITANEMLVLNPKDPGVAPFVQDLELKLCNVNTTGTLELEAYPTLDELSIRVSTLNLQRVRAIKSRLVAMTVRVQKLRDELEHLLDDDMDMAEMYLTAKLFSPQFEDSESKQNNIDEDDTVVLEDYSDEEEIRSNKSSSGVGSGQKPKIDELEKLLEVYFVQLDGALNKLSTMREYVDDTEDYINIILDDKQNQLLRVGVVISTALVLISFGIVTAGVLGMNIRIPLFDFGVPLQFDECFVGMVGSFFVLFAITLFAIKKKGLLG